jgi:hypothetical protein
MYREPPRTLTHHDVQGDNLLVAGDGEPSLALIDWQLTFRWRPGGRGGASFDDVAAEGEPIDDCGAEPGSVNGLIHQENDSFEAIAAQMG